MFLNYYFPWFTAPKNGAKLAKFENDIEYQNTFMNLLNLCTYTFQWEGLPETCNERFLELVLTLEGRACIVKDPELGFLSLKCAMDGSHLNVYGEYSKLIAYGWNGFNKSYTAFMQGSDNTDAQAVLCRDNTLCYPFYNYIAIAAKRLSGALRSIDVATKKLKTPYFIVCEESQEKSVQRVLDDVESNVDRIITSRSTMPDMFQVLPTNLDVSILSALWNSYNNYDGLIKTLLGLETATNKDKKERLLVDEVTSENRVSDVSVLHRLRWREQFCKQVNEMFGLNISVKVRDGILTEEDNEDEVSTGFDESESDIEE